MSAIENLTPYSTRPEIFQAALDDGYTPAAAEAYAVQLEHIFDEEFAIQQEGEIAAENAWLHAAENAGWQETELERQYEDAMGVVPFSEAYAASLDNQIEG